MSRLTDASRVRLDRIMSDWEALAAIGAREGGGVTRLAYSEADMEARRWFAARMEDAGLLVEVDSVGNIFGWRERPDGRPVVLTGSHIDTVPTGGNYDGVLGSICALEVMRILQEQGHRGSHPTAMIVFAGEEGSRFGSGGIGSGVLTGLVTEGDLLAPQRVDASGISLAEAMIGCGFDPTRAGEAARPAGWVRSFLELHIEQGPRLKRSGEQLGVVTHIAASARWRLVVRGETSHSGAALMDARKDALVAASEMVLAVERVARQHSVHHVVATVGTMKVYPGAANVVPGLVEMGLDVRGIDFEARSHAVQQILEEVEAAATARGVQVEIIPLSSYVPGRVSERVLDCIESVCDSLDVSHRRVISHAGHDALRIARYADIGMIFVPNQAGISHCPGEWARPTDIEASANVLLHSIARLSEDVG